MADSKYVVMDRDALVSEIKARRTAGRKMAVDLRANDDNLRAALDADDVDNGDFVPSPTGTESSKDTPPAAPAPKPQAKAPVVKPDPTKAPEGAEELTTSQLSLGAAARADGVVQREVPDDLGEYKGQYKYLATGEIFGLKIKDANDVRGHKTHHAKSPLKFWDGTAEEFRQQFDKL